MTLDNFVQSADVVIAFIIALAITAAFINLSLATRHKRKAAKACAEYWTKKNDQLEARTNDPKAIGRAINAALQKTGGTWQ